MKTAGSNKWPECRVPCAVCVLNATEKKVNGWLELIGGEHRWENRVQVAAIPMSSIPLDPKVPSNHDSFPRDGFDEEMMELLMIFAEEGRSLEYEEGIEPS